MFPRLYFFDPATGTVENGGPLFPLIGHTYATAGHHFGPWRRSVQSPVSDDLSVAGKLMAYIALGCARPEIIDVVRERYDRHFGGSSPEAREFRSNVGGWGTKFERSVRFLHPFYRGVAADLGQRYRDEDVLASVHSFLEQLLVAGVKDKIRAWKGDGPWNLTFSGGCALNIKWNNALRADPLFADVWVPPFPNDSGSAFGTAACLVMADQGVGPMDWQVRSGPPLTRSATPPGWSRESCSAAQLARLLHDQGAPVVVLNGRAELGPRALGGRSILAAPSSPAMKDMLNAKKRREHYRPVAPICLEEAAPHIFDPGTPDPYMLFEHKVRPGWAERIPAVMHLDGTARLQTVGQHDDPLVAEILREYEKVSGIPVLCNTSANYQGCGFFPDIGYELGRTRPGVERG